MRIFGKRAILNGVNLSELGYVTPLGYEVSYSFIDGGQGGLMQDGTFQEDELSRKVTVTYPIMPLDDAGAMKLLQAVYGPETTTLIYYDPMIGEERTIQTRRGQLSSGMRQRGRGGDGREYWTTGTLTLMEV